jgi:hypothetical protein
VSPATSDRISLQSALDQMLETCRPWVACARIASALHDNRLRLYCEGTLLSPAYIQTQLHLVIEQEADGRWCWDIRPARLGFAQGFDPKTAAWEVDAAGVEEMLPPPAKGPGTGSVHNWTGIVDRELRRLQRSWSKGLPSLEDLKAMEALYAHVKAHVERKTGHPLKSNKRFRARVRAFLKVPIKS